MAADAKLYTLTEVSKKTGISMPTLQRYKKEYQDRIPSEGEGRKQRYPHKALAVFKRLKKENLKKRGRPKKSGKKVAKSGKKVAKSVSGKKRARKSARKTGARRAGAGAAGAGLLSLSEIGRRTGISYPTLVNYVKKHRDKIPHEGSGRKRRFPEAAVDVFRELRAQSPRGRRKGGGKGARGARTGTVVDQAMARKIRELEKAQREVTRQLDSVLEILKRPVQVTIKSR